MLSKGLTFADASAKSEEAMFVILGVPFDRTASFRSGSREAPVEIRKSSYNFETFLFEHGVDLTDVPVYDAGDLEEMGSTEDMVIEVSSAIREIAQKSIPIVIGGEHSISPPVAEAISSVKGDNLGVLVVDAHLDFRDEYMGDKNNHACSVRRFSDIVGTDRVLPVGTRSICAEELGDANEMGLGWLTASGAMDKKPREVVEESMSRMGVDKLYLSIDIDGIDPCFAPGTGTPEPFGLDARWVKDLIAASAPFLVGMDIVEVCPPVDNGNTSILAARLIREAIAACFACCS